MRETSRVRSNPPALVADFLLQESLSVVYYPKKTLPEMSSRRVTQQSLRRPCSPATVVRMTSGSAVYGMSVTLYSIRPPVRRPNWSDSNWMRRSGARDSSGPGIAVRVRCCRQLNSFPLLDVAGRVVYFVPAWLMYEMERNFFRYVFTVI